MCIQFPSLCRSLVFTQAIWNPGSIKIANCSRLRLHARSKSLAIVIFVRSDDEVSSGSTSATDKNSFSVVFLSGIMVRILKNLGFFEPAGRPKDACLLGNREAPKTSRCHKLPYISWPISARVDPTGCSPLIVKKLRNR